MWHIQKERIPIIRQIFYTCTGNNQTEYGMWKDGTYDEGVHAVQWDRWWCDWRREVVTMGWGWSDSSRMRKYKVQKMLVDAFDELCGFSLHSLKNHLINHMADIVQTFQTIYILKAVHTSTLMGTSSKLIKELCKENGKKMVETVRAMERS